MPATLDILLSQRFLPEQGGSIRWMHEVYRRWPAPVQVITHDYYDHPILRPEFPGRPPRPPAGDDVTDAGLRLDRRDIFLADWGLDRPGKLQRYWRMTRAVRERFGKQPVANGAGRPVIRVHCTHAVPEVVSLLPLRWRYGRRLRVVCYAHGEEVTACCSSRQLKFLMRRAHGIVDLMIANSANTARLLEGHIDPARVKVVHPGVDLAEFAGTELAGRAFRAERGLGDRRMVLTVGRMDPRKNHAAVIRAVAELAGRHPDLVYVMIGQGRQRPMLEDLARELGVAQRVVFAGVTPTAEKLAAYGACDVFAMPAIRDGTDVEGFGMVFLEAGACGKPCLAGREGGQAEAVRDGQTGLVVDGGDQAQVTAALDRLLADAPLRQRLGQAARQFAAGFDWPRVVQRTLALVEELERTG